MYVLLVSCSEKLGTDWVNCSEEYLPDDIGLLYLPDITRGYFAEAFTASIYIFCSEIRPPRMSRQKICWCVFNFGLGAQLELLFILTSPSTPCASFHQ